jgi:hypothetical protein
MLLGSILMDRGKLEGETKELFERSLAIYVVNYGPDGENTALTNTDIGRFHYKLAMIQSIMSIKRRQLLLAESYVEEAIRIISKIYNPTHPYRVNAESLLSNILRELSTV